MKTKEEIKSRILFLNQGREQFKADLNEAIATDNYIMASVCARKIHLHGRLIKQLQWIVGTDN